MDKEGRLLENTKYLNKRDTAEKFAQRVATKYKDCIAVMESTGNYGCKTQLALEKYNIPYKVANPLRLKLAQSGLKTDKIDAKKLANKLRQDDIPESYVYPPHIRRQMDILRDRMNQIKARTIIINRQHSILAKYDYKVPGTDMASPKCPNFLYGLKLDGTDTRRMSMHVRDIRHINEEIKILESLIAEKALQDEDAHLIMTMHGFDAFSALLVASFISGIDRFRNAKQLMSFMGLCPRIYQSGNSTNHGKMKKAADRNLTYVMMHAALVAVRHDPKWMLKYERLQKRHPPLVAISHVANSMARCIWYMLKRREPYRHYNKNSYDAKLKRVKARIV